LQAELPDIDSELFDSEDQRDHFLQLMLGGVSPMRACQELAISYLDFRFALKKSPCLQAEINGVWETLSQNIVTALYHIAMKGNVSAQVFRLKNRPPPGWTIVEEQSEGGEAFSELSDEELVALARQEGITLPAEFEKSD